ncbi:transcriptional regulator [Leucobacter sp. HY1908]
MSDWRALKAGENVRDRRALLERAHEAFIADGAADPELFERFAQLRPIVLASWLRSHENTIDPDHAPARAQLTPQALIDLRATHPIGRVLPVVERLLVQEAQDSGFIVAVGDAAGRLLWIDGEHRMRSRAEDMGFAAGVDWSEAAVGTSAPGSAIALNHAIQVMGAEHYARAVHEWSCTAAPVHDPESGSILGVIDVTGGDGAASPHLMPLVEATVAAVHAELKLESLRALIERERQPVKRRPVARPRSATAPRKLPPRLVTLGREQAILEFAGAPHQIGGRHGEILLALAAAPRGRSAALLAGDVYGDDRQEQTLRAELVRLRKWLSAQDLPLRLESRPYRLAGELRVDALEALEALERGAHRLALAAYEGPVLPGSDAPVANRLREDVDATLREAMLQQAAAEALFEYAQNWAQHDIEVWQTLLQVLPPLSPKRARVVTKLGELQRE